MSHESKQLELRRQAKSMMAKIRCTYPSRPSAEKYAGMVGTILQANENFCYLIVRRSFISDDDDAYYTIYLPDGSNMVIGASDFTIPPSHEGLFAGCYIYHDKVSYDLTQIAAVQFGEDVVDFDEVHLCDFSNAEDGISLNVTGGRVLYASDRFFEHDCGQSTYTAHGAPVFFENGELVGICTQSLQGVSTALTVSAIKENLNHIY